MGSAVCRRWSGRTLRSSYGELNVDASREHVNLCTAPRISMRDTPCSCEAVWSERSATHRTLDPDKVPHQRLNLDVLTQELLHRRPITQLERERSDDRRVGALFVCCVDEEGAPCGGGGDRQTEVERYSGLCARDGVVSRPWEDSTGTGRMLTLSSGSSRGIDSTPGLRAPAADREGEIG